MTLDITVTELNVTTKFQLPPLLHLSALSAYTDTTTGETGTFYFVRYFYYSIDGVNYSNRIELTDGNLAAISFANSYAIFCINLEYVTAGTVAGSIHLTAFNIVGTYLDAPLYPKFQKSLFNGWFDPEAPEVLSYAINQLQKLYAKNQIVPNYIIRGNNGNQLISTSPAGQILTSSITDISKGGSGWLVNDTFIISGGSATGKVLSVGVSGRIPVLGIPQFGIATGGTGYAVNDTFTIDGGVTLATGKVSTVSAGVITSYTILTTGLGYPLFPGFTGRSITATSGVGTGATLNLNSINVNGIVLTYEITDPGEGYSVGSNISTITAGSGVNLLINILSVSPASTISEDNDYLTFWFAICHFWGWVVIYARLFQTFPTNLKLLQNYLYQQGIYFDPINDDIDDLTYLMENFYREIAIRGSLDQTKIEGINSAEVNGEIRRLIGWISTDDFLYTLVPRHKSGWNIGNSSPLHRGLKDTQYTNKNYELNPFQDLSKYPTIGTPSILENNTLLLKPGDGIGNTVTPPTKAIVIEETQNYQIKINITPNITNNIITSSKVSGGSGYAAGDTFTIDGGLTPALGRVLTVSSGVVSTYEIISGGNSYSTGTTTTTIVTGTGSGLTINVLTVGTTSKLLFGVNIYDIDGNLLDCLSALDATTVTNNFLSNYTANIDTIALRDYEIRGILYTSNSPAIPSPDGLLNISTGNNLILPVGAKYLVPFIKNLNTATNYIVVNELIIKISSTPYSTGFIQTNHLTHCIYKNNNVDLSPNLVRNVLREKFINYNSWLIVFNIKPVPGTIFVNPIEWIFSSSDVLTSYFNGALVGRLNIILSLDGLIQYPGDQFTYNYLTGIIVFIPPVMTSQKLVIFIITNSVPIVKHTFILSDDLTQYTDSSLIGTNIGFSLDGIIQFSDTFTFNSTLGKITPTTNFSVGQRLVVFTLPLPVIEHIFISTDDLTQYTDSSLINQDISFALDGIIQSSLENFIFNRAIGQIIPITDFSVSQKLSIFILPST